MLRVSISQIIRTEDGDGAELLAQFMVDSTGVHPEAGERTEVVARIPVIDPATGERIESGSDPERWARLLPTALRAGDLAVLVEELEAPVPALASRDRIADLAAAVPAGGRREPVA